MQLPQEFTEKMQALLGEEAPEFFACYDKEERRQALRLNRLKLSDPDCLVKEGFSLEPVPWTVDGYTYPSEQRPGRHIYHDAGLYYIQEPSAMAPAALLDAKPGEKVLDLCAAPGGKSTQIASAMQGEGLFISNEIHPARAKILSQNIERMGVRNAVVLNETPERLADRFPGFFDRILVDAPCSGEGMFRKEPAALEEWTPDVPVMCAQRQSGILDCAARMLRPGGRLVYSTCTFAPEENEGAISAFLHRHPDWFVEEVKGHPAFAPGRPDWVDDPAGGIEHTFRLWPHRLHGEGHYAAVLRKNEDAEGTAILPEELTQRSTGDNWKDYRDFMESVLKDPIEDRLFLFGDNVYRLPEGTPNLNKLKVVRPGWQLGTFRKRRFEPAHAFAMGLTPGEVKAPLSLDVNSKEVKDYLQGLTFPAEEDGKGWRLVLAGNFPLGWAKIAGGTVKNHYPKGLRRVGEHAF